jgi:hypothetical protein
MIIIFEHRYDVDGSGSLDVEEVTALLHDRGFRMSSAEISGVFEAIDDDGNGVLDLSELRKMWTFLGAWREERREESGQRARQEEKYTSESILLAFSNDITKCCCCHCVCMCMSDWNLDRHAHGGARHYPRGDTYDQRGRDRRGGHSRSQHHGSSG